MCRAATSRILGGLLPRRHFLCESCFLIFVPAAEHLSIDEELQRYRLHRNSLEDPGYVRLLETLIEPAMRLLERGDPAEIAGGGTAPAPSATQPVALSPSCPMPPAPQPVPTSPSWPTPPAPRPRCLDFGCGPTPVLARLIERRGALCDCFDPLFDPATPRPPYDVVFASEVIEHFRAPWEDLQRLVGMAAAGGLLAVMTERWTTVEAFARWHYTSDPTHVAFYHARTLERIVRTLGLRAVYDDGARVTVFRAGR